MTDETVQTREAPTEALRIEYLEDGCVDYTNRFGFAMMMPGYLCFYSSSCEHFFGVRARDGQETEMHWDRWAIYRWARADFRQRAAVPPPEARND